MTQYDKLDILGDTSATREEVFPDVVASAFLSARNFTRSASYDTWSRSKLHMV